MTAPVQVDFINVFAGSGRVLRRTFESEALYLAWLDSVRPMVELVAVRPLHPVAS